jgi:hypothetical protein
VAYYDCRFNDPSPGLPTDRWLVTCHPTGNRPATNPANWGGESRLTAQSFDMEQTCAPFFTYNVGDYEGLATAGIGFLAVFAAVDGDNITSIFFRQAGPLQDTQQ